MAKILYFAPEDWAFVSHFRPLAQAATASGFEVVVATRVRRHGAALAGEGYKLIALKSDRGRLNPWRLLKSFWEMACCSYPAMAGWSDSGWQLGWFYFRGV